MQAADQVMTRSELRVLLNMTGELLRNLHMTATDEKTTSLSLKGGESCFKFKTEIVMLATTLAATADKDEAMMRRELSGLSLRLRLCLRGKTAKHHRRRVRLCDTPSRTEIVMQAGLKIMTKKELLLLSLSHKQAEIVMPEN